MGVDIELIFALQAAVSEVRANFQNCHNYLVMKLVHLPKFQELHIYSPSNPRGQNGAYSRSTGNGF